MKNVSASIATNRLPELPTCRRQHNEPTPLGRLFIFHRPQKKRPVQRTGMIWPQGQQTKKEAGPEGRHDLAAGPTYKKRGRSRGPALSVIGP